MKSNGATYVDRRRRDVFAEALRHFAAGQMTNDEWDETWLRLGKTDDAVIDEIWGLMWTKYDDLHEHRLTGQHALSDEWRGYVIRMILFLYSDLPYEWPAQRRWRSGEFLLALVTLGLVNRNPRLPHPMRDPANRDRWPFYRVNDLTRTAASRPTLLAGIVTPPLGAADP